MLKYQKKVILYYNPEAGSGVFNNNLDVIIRRYQEKSLMIIPIRSASAGENAIDSFLKTLDQDSYREEYAQIIAAGGNGTINMCVNSMIRNNIDLPLAIMPAGTANDLAIYFNIPNDIDKMIDIALSNEYTYADVGKVNDKYFINSAAAGNIIGVSQKTDPFLKNTIGMLAYYIKGLQEIPNLKAADVKITADNKVYREKILLMLVMNGKSIGKFDRLSPESVINDNMMEIILFKDMHFFQVPLMLFKLTRGVHLNSRKVLTFKGREILVESDKKLPSDIDGEPGTALPLKFSVLHNKLKICTLNSDGEDTEL